MTLENNILGKNFLPVDQGDGERVSTGDGGFDLASLVQMVLVRQRIIVGTAVTVLVLTAIMVFRMVPLYDASAVVMLDQRQNKVTDVNAVLTGLSTDQTSIENQINILKSRSLMARVVDKLNLDKGDVGDGSGSNAGFSVLYWLNPLHWLGDSVSTKTAAELRQERRDDAIDGLLGSATVSELGLSSAMSITYRSPDPNKSAQIANAIADAYVEDQLYAKFEATQKTTQWLADRLKELSNQMQAADAAVQEYKAEHNIREIASGGSVVDQQLAQLNGQLVTARSDLAGAQARYARVRQLQASGQAEDVAQVFQSGMIEQLRAQQADLLRQRAQLATTFGPRHPKMLDIESQLRNIDEKIGEEVKRVVETLANDVAVASAHVSSLEASLSVIESQSTDQSKAQIKLTELESRATSAHQLYEAFLGKFKETQGQEAIQTPDARVISKAVPPGGPVSPNKTRALELAAAGGLLLGLLFAYGAERLDSGFRTTGQIERLLGVPVLTTLPEQEESSVANTVDLIVNKPMSSYAEAMRGLKMGLLLSDVDRKQKVFLVTSSVPAEGKSSVSLGLARIFARANQKVVLLDGDLRRPSLAKYLEFPDGTEGLIEVLSGTAELTKCLVRDPLSDVMFLPTSPTSGNPPDLLSSKAMERLLQTLRETFDVIVIDSAPLLPVNDTKILTRLADTVLFVVRWEKTPRNAAASAARMLLDIKAHVAGVVLSRANVQRYRYYNYGAQSYQGYDTYYGG